MVHTIRVIFRGGSIIDLKLITCKNNIIITLKLQIYLLHWYYTYLLHPGMDIEKAMILQHLYWTNIIYAIRKEVTNCDTCQRTKRSNKNMVNYQLS